RGADTVRLPLAQGALPAAPAVPAAPALVAPRAFALLGGAPDPARDSDRVVIGRPLPGGTYKWFFLPGTVAEVTGRVGGAARVRLDQSLEVWVDSADAVPLPAGFVPARRVVGGARVVPAAEWVDFVVPTGERAPYLVTQEGASLVLTLYGTTFSPDIVPILANDTLVRQIVWEQEATDRARVELRLARPAYGYQVLWDAARGAMVLRVRRPPVVNRARPLAGLTIVVDAGHPPGGAAGPTGLVEPVAVLPVAERVKALLEARGAKVVMTRTTAAPVALGARPVIARRANANAFVSIHLNAFPDGVDPFRNAGTSTLFYNQHSEPLARLVQRALAARLGLRDLGVHYQNLAVARPTWYPAVLCEGAFLMFPEQENAMRDPGYRQRYADGIVEGLEKYFAELGR
ncbi:MAG: N-acetylmuramoyl-L-alanine amidase, partial [Gemmatimonadaceae bacterium]